MTPEERDLYALIGAVRRCFNRLKSVADALHRDLGVSASMRAVMEALTVGGRQSVPAIARARSVTRQHIQTIMNALLADGLVTAVDNPAHRRSPLFELTARGHATFAAIRAREEEPLRRLAAGMPARSVEDARAALQTLNRLLAQELSKGESHDPTS